MRPIIQANWIWKLAAVAATGVQFVGCSSARSSGPIEVVYWTGWSGHEYEIQQNLIEEFNRTHPNVRVRMLTQFSSTG
jgi:ABC-type glycerol-3-phosphate transport system substrate-binding protein